MVLVLGLLTPEDHLLSYAPKCWRIQHFRKVHP